jgi:hypothetical protein
MNLREEDQEFLNFIDGYGDFFFKNFPMLKETFGSYYEGSCRYFGYPQEPAGSIFTSEGRSIYMLIRSLKPKKILEVGNFLGRSSNFILKAVEDNGFGEVTLLDIIDRLEYEKLHSKNFTRIIDDSIKYLDRPLDFDLYVIDGCHEYGHVKKEMSLILKNTTKPIWIWSHDYFKVLPPQCEVKRALDEIVDENKDRFKVFTPMIEKTSNCGIAIMKYE